MARRKIPAEVSSARKYQAYLMRTTNPRMTYAQITRKLNEMFPEFPLKSEHQAVEKMIKEAEKEFIRDHKQKIEDVKEEIGIVLDFVRQEAAEAWERSKEPIKIVKKREEKPVEQSARSDPGEPQFLKRMIEAVEVKGKVFGAMAPRKHEVTGRGGEALIPPPAIDLKALGPYLSNEDLDKIQQAAEIVERAQRDLEAAKQNRDRR